jgi:hypothetical protein
MSVKSSILALFKDDSELSVKEIVDRLHVSKQMAHIALNQLLTENVVEKLGRTPKTIYRLIDPTKGTISKVIPDVSESDTQFLKQNFLIVTETGSLLEGIEAFDLWCTKRKLPLLKTLAEYIETKQKYSNYYDDLGFINGMEKIKNTKGYDKIWLNDLIYLDFYAIERFGKTRLGTLLHYAKQGQNKFLMSIIIKEVKDRINSFLKSSKADAIGFVPPTIRREVQFMKYLKSHLHIPLPVIDIKKLSGIIPVPQKSLSKLDERIKNADNTFAIADTRKFKHIVLIDDAVGSGSTLNEIAKKVKNKMDNPYVTGLALVGSFKGFDVITDV